MVNPNSLRVYLVSNTLAGAGIRTWMGVHWMAKTDRSVLSSIRIAAQDVEFGFLEKVPNVLLISPLEVAKYLNERPVTIYGKYIWPAKEMKKTLTAEPKV